jgi:pyruvate dehydrogenase E1 component beta subunit
MATGAGAGFGAQHSQPVENWFLNVPGLKICVPGTPADMYGLLRAAIEDPDPVLVFEHKHLFNLKGELADAPPPVAIGQAEIVRAGDDLTLVAIQSMRHRAVDAAEQLASEGIEVEVIDPRTLAPLDLPTIFESVERTKRLIVVQEATNSGSWGATVIAEVMAARFESLDSPPVMVGGDDTPIPYARPMENAWIPSVERIVASVRESIAY